MSVLWRCRFRLRTEYSADSVEWCPVEPAVNLMAVGTYQLDKDQVSTEKQKRLGRIHLYQVDVETTDLKTIQTIDTPGILDQKWCYHNIEVPVLGIVTSTGTLELYKLEESRLKLWLDTSIGTETLALSLDWSSNKYHFNDNIVVSDSSGTVTVIKVGEGLEEVGTWKAHGFEAWIAAFNYWDPNIFYSGGDDCVFKGYDVRVPEVATVTNRSHEAGVTAIRSHIDVEHQLLTGSYDEKVRLWDVRSLKRCITESNVNGGVWRLKWHPRRPDYVLAACMYGGFRILRVHEQIDVVCEYLEHESIAYGADWRMDRDIVGTCSFYDCSLHVSEISL